jgi:mono/diheme cytochrome c family protein
MNRGTLVLSVTSIVLAGCRYGAGLDVEQAPDQIMAFQVLYGENCAGCHGAVGNNGAANALADPVFLAMADDATIRRTLTSGVPGTPMPAFAQSAGGMLTDKQIDALVRGIRGWANPADQGKKHLATNERR